jgi:hypothetical protein
MAFYAMQYYKVNGDVQFYLENSKVLKVKIGSKLSNASKIKNRCGGSK